MNSKTKIVLIVALVAIGVLDFLVYRSSDLYMQARRIAEPEVKIRMLQKANKIFPWNELVYYELGKTHFGMGIQSLNEGRDALFHVTESVKNLEHGIRINPASPFGHFYYAQSLLYENLLTQSENDRIFKESRDIVRGGQKAPGPVEKPGRGRKGFCPGDSCNVVAVET